MASQIPPKPPPGRPKPWPDDCTPVYHITDVSNLQSMVESNAMLCDRDCGALDKPPVSIAYQDLKARRAETPVHGAEGGTLADYVPFYFAPRSPMLYAIAYGYVPGCEGQDDIVHLVFCLEDLSEAGKFVITDGHPIKALTWQYFSIHEGLATIDWKIMYVTIWRDTDEDGDRKRRRQAEFLVHRSVPFRAVRLIGAGNEATARRAAEAVAAMASPPPVIVRTSWYY